MEHRGALWANNLIIDNKPSEKPVINIKSKSEPRIDPLGTTVSAVAKKDIWP